MIPLASEAEGHTLQSLHQVSCDALLVELQRIGFNITTRELNRLCVFTLDQLSGKLAKLTDCLDILITLAIPLGSTFMNLDMINDETSMYIFGYSTLF
jgi:hypothetical protein